MKSMCHEARRNSPSVTDCSPTSRCIVTTLRISSSSMPRRSSAEILPAVWSSRAWISRRGRSRLPTWSARNGGFVRRPPAMASVWVSGVMGYLLALCLHVDLYSESVRVAEEQLPRPTAWDVVAHRRNPRRGQPPAHRVVISRAEREMINRPGARGSGTLADVQPQGERVGAIGAAIGYVQA